MSIPSSLNGCRALVTGAGQRLGQSIAIALGERAMHVAVHFRSSEHGAEQTVRAIEAAGGRAFAVGADLTRPGAPERLVDDAVQRLGGLDLLVASAANFERILFDDLDATAWSRTMDLNLTSQVFVARQAVPQLRESRGSVVFVTCSSVEAPYRQHLPYVVSKAALHQLTRALALELAPLVRVNAVGPGTVLPPVGLSEKEVADLARRIPLGRIGTPDDVARAVVFLAESPFITGQQILVDGGRALARAGVDA